MDRKKVINNTKFDLLFNQLVQLHDVLEEEFKIQYNRALPFADELFDRWEKAKKLGFGSNSSIYDSSYLFGDVKVGKNTWIGPFTIIDGSGGLSIGDNCTISAGVHIYSHDNVAQTLTGGKANIERDSVEIGECTYVGPNTIIKKGITIGTHCLIGAGSFVNTNIPSHSVAVGTPAKIIGKTFIKNDQLSIEYFSKKPVN